MMLPIFLLMILFYNIDSITNLILSCTLMEILIYLFSMTKMWSHLIMMVILLEFFSLKLFLTVVILYNNMFMGVIIYLMLVMMVVEAMLGMSLVVNISRAFGGENLTI